ncbi:MAG: endonuclease III [Candidatus Ryanbacteria bacterium]|nr:endonuclease III [Candidatus Ryanbacteria bacterium]
MDRFRKYTKSWIKSETAAQKHVRAGFVLRKLGKVYPRARIVLNFANHIQLLVAVILSAQCTDKKVNEVTRVLFKRYRTVRDFAHARQEELQKYIRPTGFFRAKAKNIIGAAGKIERDFGGKLPRTMKEMTTLPGVARKTANIVLGNAYGIVEGIAVDTHVSRISQRLGLTTSDNPVKIELDLMGLFPKKSWFRSTYYMIEHGRAICTSRNRKCEICPLKDVCPSSLV